MQISESIIFINEIWDRIEKVIFLFVDAGLNLYFIYLVRVKLIANGLTKYTVLFKFNLLMVAMSLPLDVSISNPPSSYMANLRGAAYSYWSYVTSKRLCVR